MTRALLYLRQSDSDGAGERSLSLDSQASVLRADADRLGWCVVAEIRDADQKGWNPQRPGLLETYDRCRAGDVDLVAFWSLSRLARKVRIVEEIFDELTALGIELYSHEESWVAESMMRQVFAAFHEQQTRDIQAHVRRALHERTRQGKPHGRAPWGYVRDKAGGAYVPDPETAPDVARLFDLCAAGLGPLLVADELTRRGIPTPRGHQRWRMQTVAYVRANPVYRGAIEVGGTVVPGAHPPLVPPEVWEAANRPSSRQRAPRRKERASWLEGLIEHGCGHPMYLIRAGERTAFRCRAGSRGFLWSGSPTCALSPRAILQHRAEALAWDALTRDLETLPSLSRIVATAKRRYRAHAPASVAVRRDTLERKKRAAERRKRAEGLYLSGARDRAWFDAEDAVAGAEIAETEAALAALPALPDEAVIAVAYDRVRSLSEALPHLDGDGRRGLLAVLGVAVIESGGASFSRGNGGQARIRYHAEFAPLFAAKDT